MLPAPREALDALFTLATIVDEAEDLGAGPAIVTAEQLARALASHHVAQGDLEALASTLEAGVASHVGASSSHQRSESDMSILRMAREAGI